MKNKTIVFFGDSITDTCKCFNPNFSYGAGYVNMLNTELQVLYQDQNIKIMNSGVGGDKTENLLSRIQKDVFDKNPDIVFLLIGINDVWHPYADNKIPNIKEIMQRYDSIVKQIQEKNIRLITMTPFLFPIDSFFESLFPYFTEIYNEISSYIQSHNLECIDLYPILKEYADLKGNDVITKDGVHPTFIGHGVIAYSVLEYLNKTTD